MALRNTDNNVERAIEWISAIQYREEDPGSVETVDQQMGQGAQCLDGDARYELSALSRTWAPQVILGITCVISQKGRGRQLSFNDNKVAMSMKASQGAGLPYQQACRASKSVNPLINEL